MSLAQWTIRACATIALASMVLVSGCPPGGGGPVKSCTKAYERCQLADGVLGICDTTACAPNATPPCLVCRSQH